MNVIRRFVSLADDSFKPLIIGMGEGWTIGHFLNGQKDIVVEVMAHLKDDATWAMARAFRSINKDQIYIHPEAILKTLRQNVTERGRRFDFIWLEQNAVDDTEIAETIDMAYRTLISGGTLCISGVVLNASIPKHLSETTQVAYDFTAELTTDKVTHHTTSNGDGVLQILRKF